MTQEQKEFLLKDLCTRIPYSIKVNIINRESKNRIVELTEDNICHLTNDWWSECKPYLFPMSSMTKEQIDELKDLCDMYDPINDNDYCEDWGTRIITKNIMNDGYRFNFNFKLFEFLNKNRLDYNGLIPMELALDATNLNIY